MGERTRRQSTGDRGEARFNWSVRMVAAQGGLPADCSSLPVVESAPRLLIFLCLLV